MIKLLRKTVLAFVLAPFLVACGTAETIQPLPTEEKQGMPTVFLSSTAMPTVAATSTPLITAFPTTPAQATIAAFDSLCVGAKEILDSEMSPNDKWIAATCYSENGTEESPLQVVSIDGSKEWKIYFRDYAKRGREYGRKNIIIPYHWSKDGTSLYVVSPTIASGCCWIGGQYVLLVRLNLVTGEQIELPDETGFGASFTISEDDRFLLFTPNTNQPYDNFLVLDLSSGRTRMVKLEDSEYIDLEFAVMSPYEDVIVLPFFKNTEFNDFVVISLASIDLQTNEQRILVSGIKKDEGLYPLRWIDKEHVLLSNANPFAYHYSSEPPVEHWSLNISTGLREKVEKP